MQWGWVDERRMPKELLELMEIEDIPKELSLEIESANNEINDHGAVSYITKANVEHYLHKHFFYLQKLVDEIETKDLTEDVVEILDVSECVPNRVEYGYNGGYVGLLKDGKMHGQGVFTWQNGAEHIGEFNDGQRHGQGKMTYSDGTIEEGRWVENEFLDE